MGRMDIFHLACQMGRETSTALKHSEKKGRKRRREGRGCAGGVDCQCNGICFIFYSNWQGRRKVTGGRGQRGEGSAKGNWAWSLRFAPADCKISDLRSCGLRDKMQSVVDPACAPLHPPPPPSNLCLYNLSIHQAHNKAIKATLESTQIP